jgi:thiamine pyrophosphate-dependent acetolactate synthase large subunit-like protein
MRLLIGIERHPQLHRLEYHLVRLRHGVESGRFVRVVAQGLGAYGELVEDSREIRPAIERAAAEVGKGRPALVNVITEPTAAAHMAPFASYGGESAGTSLM